MIKYILLTIGLIYCNLKIIDEICKVIYNDEDDE